MRLRRLTPVAIALVLLTSVVEAGQTNAHDLQIVLSADPPTVASGNQVAITMTCRNNGPLNAANCFVTAPTPTGTTFVSASTTKGQVTTQPNPGGTGAIGAGLGPLAVDEVATVTLVLAVEATPGTTITAQGMIQPQFPSGDQIQGNNNSSVQVPVVAPTTADIAAEIAAGSETAGAGSLFTYTITVSNLTTSPGLAPRDPATLAEVHGSLPEGSVFSSISISQGEAVGLPDVGEFGPFAVKLNTLEEGASATVDLTVEIVANPGHILSFTAIAESEAADPDPTNNTANVTTTVEASAQAALDWEEPEPPSAAVPLPPPQRLVVTEGAAPGAARIARGGAVTGYNVYRSNKPGVAPSPGNFFMSVPPTQTSAAAPVAPGGSFFTVTAQYDAGESAPSNEGSAEVPASSLSSVKVKPTKITATGAGFTDTVAVFVDGIPFVAPAKVKKANSKVIQKGNLLTGLSLGQYLDTHPSVLLTFRNSNGGVTTYRYPQ